MLRIERRRLEISCAARTAGTLAAALDAEFPLVIEGLRHEYLKRLFPTLRDQAVTPHAPAADSPLLDGDLSLAAPGVLLFYRIPREAKFIEAGFISREDSPASFDAFCTAIEHWAAGLGVVGTWEMIDPAGAALADLDQDALQISRDTVENRAAEVLEDPEARAILSRIYSTENTLLNTLAGSFDSDTLERLCGRFAELGLITRDYVVLCRKSGQQILRVASRESIDETSQKGFKCFVCGNPLSQEQIDELLAGTEAGKHLLEADRWLTLRLAAVLKDLGLRADAVRIHPGREGFFLAFINFQHHLVLLGIAGRPLTLEDLYILNAHLHAGKIGRCAIISTHPLPALFRRHLAGEHPQTVFNFIEGLENLKVKLREMFKAAEQGTVKDLLEGFDSLTAMELEPSLARLFSTSTPPPVPERGSRKGRKDGGKRKEAAVAASTNKPAAAQPPPTHKETEEEEDSSFLEEVLPE